MSSSSSSSFEETQKTLLTSFRTTDIDEYTKDIEEYIKKEYKYRQM